jgi:hypothetical protein
MPLEPMRLGKATPFIVRYNSLPPSSVLQLTCCHWIKVLLSPRSAKVIDDLAFDFHCGWDVPKAQLLNGS